MIDDSIKKSWQHHQESDRSHQLLGKAVLLIGNDAIVLQNLVMQLAQKGANVALLCWQLPLEVAEKMKEHVQSFGRQLILIERAENQRFSVEQLIHNVITKWGHFDVFIDVSAKGKIAAQDNDEANDEAKERDETEAWPPPKWRLTRTILEEMIHA